MQFESLKIFCDVARLRSFSQGAKANGVTQSAASQVVHQLEERLRVQLIDRSTRPLHLTPVGRKYYEGCQGLVAQYLELEASIRQAEVEMAPTVTVAAIYSVGLGDMGQLVERFKELQPHAHVHIDYLHPDRVYERVLDGAADIGLVSFPRKNRILEVIPWRDEEMVLTCAPRHALAGERRLQPAKLQDQRFVAFDKDLTIRREIDRFLREHHVTVEVELEFDNIENIKKAVEIGAGVALLPAPTVQNEVEQGTLVAVPLADVRFVRPIGIIHHRQHKLSATVLLFMDLLRQAQAPDASNGKRPRLRLGERQAAGGNGADTR
ncbi:MAG: LysR family transcriptional regulator [Gemmataceae bacterium]